MIQYLNLYRFRLNLCCLIFYDDEEKLIFNLNLDLQNKLFFENIQFKLLRKRAK